MLDGLRREIALIREADTRALDLQAKEYERRLSELNHAHQIAADNWRTSLSRETFETFKDGYAKWQVGVSEALTAQATAMASNITSTRRLMALIGAVLVASGGIIGAYVTANANRLDKLEIRQTEIAGIQHERSGRFDALERRLIELEGRRRIP